MTPKSPTTYEQKQIRPTPTHPIIHKQFEAKKTEKVLSSSFGLYQSLDWSTDLSHRPKQIENKLLKISWPSQRGL